MAGLAHLKVSACLAEPLFHFLNTLLKYLVECTIQCAASSIFSNSSSAADLTKLLLITFSGKHALPQSNKSGRVGKEGGSSRSRYIVFYIRQHIFQPPVGRKTIFLNDEKKTLQEKT